MSLDWSQVPKGHRTRYFDWKGLRVRSRCQCGWTSTLTTSVEDARKLWQVHIRSLVQSAR